MFKRRLPLIVTFLVGVLVIVAEFIPHRPFNQLSGGLEDWFLIISSFAIILGQMSLIKINWLKVKYRAPNWPYFVVTLVSFFVMVLVGIFWGTQESKGLMNGKYEEAVKCFQLSLAQQPDNPDAWVQIGKAYTYRNSLGKAVTAYEQALKLDAGNRVALADLADVYDKRGQSDLSAQMAARLNELPPAPDNPQPPLDEAYLLKRVESMRQAVAENPNNTMAWRDLGQSMFQLGLYGEAVTALKKSVAIQPNDAGTQYLLGQAYMEGDETGTFMGGKKPFDYLFDNVYQHLSATMFALLAFFIASAAYRAFIGRTVESNLLLISAVLVMLGNTTLGSNLTAWLPAKLSFLTLPALTEFIMKYPNTAGQRAIMICAGLGIIGSSLRILLGIERSYLGGDE